MNIKIIFAIISTIIGVGANIRYLRDILKKQAQPHIYSWLIWAVTSGIAAGGIWYGGGSWGSLEIACGSIFVFSTFLISLKYGSKNITSSDKILLISILFAAALWLIFRNPLPTVLAITIIDTVAYIPSWRKVFSEPWSETLTVWIGYTVGNFFSIAALKEYNLLTLSYLLAINLANIVLITICLIRRISKLKPNQT